MFTGLIEEVGKINSIQKSGDAIKITVNSSEINKDMSVDDSISVNGVCLTVTEFTEDSFAVTAVEETMRKTNLSNLQEGISVNLERAMKADKRFGGHYVQGHVDQTTEIYDINRETENWIFSFKVPDNGRKYIVDRGSITVNGVSLTIASISDSIFNIAIIPHTYENTVFKNFNVGDQVNLEYDIIGKYVENILKYRD
ncbi:MAG: riboflavin synthase [Chlorobiota bacterium]